MANIVMMDDASVELRQPSGRGKIVGFGVVILIVALIGSIGVIGYFGIGPMFIRPVVSHPVDSSPDVASVLGASVTPTVMVTPTSEAGLVPVQLPQDQMQTLISNLGQTVMVPREVPEVSLIEDPKLLADQAFFALAKANDLVVIFRSAKIGYLYRPSTDTVVAQGSIN